MKKILIVIYDMRIGGAQKSLLSFLQALSAAGKSEEYEVYVMPMNPVGTFLDQIPADIRVVRPPNILRWLGCRLSGKLLTKHFSLRGLLGEAMWILRSKLKLLPRSLNIPQKLWRVWKPFVPACREAYDVAVSYIDGTASYYVMDKVVAKKKVLWLHSDYQKQGYDPAFDAPYYQACDAVVTVSVECRETIRQALPEIDDKLHVLENISSWQTVLDRSREGTCPEYGDADGLKLLCVGRLHEQKGMDIAVEAARCLKVKDVRFRWLVVGDGSERAKLERMIAAYDLVDCFQLIGSRENPYIYMRECDILVQPSRIEGKSIVLDEAKMLCKPIVAAAYPTVRDAIIHGETGLVAEINGEAIAEAILRMQEDDVLRGEIIHRLGQLCKGNEDEMRRYIEIMF